jgi:hypothetical protein
MEQVGRKFRTLRLFEPQGSRRQASRFLTFGRTMIPFVFINEARLAICIDKEKDDRFISVKLAKKRYKCTNIVMEWIERHA